MSAAGLASKLGLLETPSFPGLEAPSTAFVIGRLVELWRRERRMTVVQFAEHAGLDRSDVLAAEEGRELPSERVLDRFGRSLGLSTLKLRQLVRHEPEAEEAIGNAAQRFATQLRRVDELTSGERDALQTFLAALRPGGAEDQATTGPKDVGSTPSGETPPA